MGFYKNNAAIFFSALLCFNLPLQIHALAVSEAPVSATNTPNFSDTENLIFDYSQSIQSGSGKIYLNTQTTSSQTMAEIGVIDLEVQYSMNGVNGWTPLLFPSDQTSAYTTEHALENFEISVFHNRYYRVVLTHYALEPGLILPDSQSIYETTNTVWVS